MCIRDRRMAVTREHVAKLSLLQLVVGRDERLLHVILQSKTAGDAHRVGQLADLHEDLVGNLQHHGILRLWQIARAAEKIEARAGVVPLVHVRSEQIKSLDLDEEIHSLGLSVVLHVEGDDLTHESKKILNVSVLSFLGALILATVELCADLSSQVADVLRR